MQNEANGYYDEEENKLSTDYTSGSVKKVTVLDQQFQHTCNELIDAIKPIETDTQKVLQTYKADGRLVLQIVDLSKFKFDFSTEQPLKNITDFMNEESIDEALKVRLSNALTTYLTKELPEKFQTATGDTKIAMAAQILGIDPKNMVSMKNAVDTLVELRSLLVKRYSNEATGDELKKIAELAKKLNALLKNRKTTDIFEAAVIKINGDSGPVFDFTSSSSLLYDPNPDEDLRDIYWQFSSKQLFNKMCDALKVIINGINPINTDIDKYITTRAKGLTNNTFIDLSIRENALETLLSPAARK